MPGLSEEAEVLNCLRKMSEPELHKIVVHPLLHKMGARFIRYVHGAFERGKDFVYIAKDFYGKDELTVCQVKNEKLSGDFSSTSSTAAFLHQAIHCTRTKVLNPVSSQKEIPQRVTLITTYPLPDAALADAEPLLDEVRAKCKVIGPEDIVQLLHDHLEDLYIDFAHPGEVLFRAIRRHVIVHHEASAFDLDQRRKLTDFFVNIGVGQTDSTLGDIIAGILRPPKQLTRTIAQSDYYALRALYDQICTTMGTSGGFDARSDSKPGDPPPATAAEPDRHSHFTVNVDIPLFLRQIKKHFAQVQVDLKKSQSGPLHRDLAGNAISFLRQCEDFSRALLEFFGDELFSRAKPTNRNWETPFFLQQIDPAAILDGRENVCIIGDAGAGKTCFVRMLTQTALDAGLRCIYFPCSRIRRNATNLSDEVSHFLHTLDPSWNSGPTQRLFDNIDILILDGCDEAANFGEELARQITGIGKGRSLRSAVVVGEHSANPNVPTDLRDAIACQPTRRGMRITVEESLSESDFCRLIACNRDNAFTSALGDMACTRKPRVIVTTRLGARMPLPRTFQYLCLRPFDDEQLDAFFRKWCEGVGKDYEEIMTFFRDNEHVKDICRTPLNATIVAALYENGYDLPKSRVELYQQRFALLLDRWDRMRHVAQRTRVSKTDKLRYLGRLALTLHVRHARRFTMAQGERLWNIGFAQLYHGLSFEEVLAEMQCCNCVVFSEGGGYYSLGHLSYQEFLAAHAIAWGERLDLLVERFFDPWWRQTLVFYAGIASDIGRLLDILQGQGRLIDHGGLIEEMMAEARYTRPLVRQVIGDLCSAGDLDDDVPFEADEDVGESPEDDDSETKKWKQATMVQDVFGRMRRVEGVWQCELTLELLCGRWFVDIEADEGGPDERQVRAFLEVAANQSLLREKLGIAIADYCTREEISENVFASEEDLAELPSMNRLGALERDDGEGSEDVWDHISPLVLSIPPQPGDGNEYTVCFAFEHEWDTSRSVNITVRSLEVVAAEAKW